MVTGSEVVIAGGGTAGCVLATRLVQRGYSVTLIEAGPDYGPLRGGGWPRDLLDATSLPTSHDWGYAAAGAGGHPLVLDRARVIGGCSAHNGCTQNTGWAGDYDRWSADDCPEWSSAALRPVFDRAIDQLRLHRYTDEEIQPFHRVFLDSCRAAGIAVRDDLLNLDAGESAGCGPVNVADGVRRNTAIAYLDEVRDRAGLTILSHAVVTRVVVSQGRARGVDVLVDGRRSHVAGDVVVVSAGTYGTSEVLLRSGIGPSAALRELGLDVVVDLPGVGNNLHDHVAAHLEFAGTRELAEELATFARDRWLPEEQTILKLRSPFSDGPFDLHVYPWVERDAATPEGWRIVVPVSQVRPRSRGSVRLTSPDPGVVGTVDTAWFSDPDDLDLRSVVHGVEWVLDEVLSGPLRRFLGARLGGELTEQPRASTAQWTRDTHSHYWHPVGTSRMGSASDPRTVVDSQARVLGVQGLHVADASVFPDVPRATPALPTVVVAERVAELLDR